MSLLLHSIYIYYITRTILQIEYTGLTDILQFGADLANLGLFVAHVGTRQPSKHSERSSADLSDMPVSHAA